MQLWCGYLCSPYQSSFVVDESKIPGLEIRHVTYYVDPEYAKSIYDSCKDGTLDGGVVVGQAFQDYQDFISFAALTILGMQRITVVYRPTSEYAYQDDAIPCRGFCPCETCQDSCSWDLAINGSGCHVGMFGDQWRCETLILAISYYCFLVLLASGIVVYYFVKGRNNMETDLAWFASLLLPIVGVVVLSVGLLLWPALLEHKDVQVFGTYWSWATASMVGGGLALILLGVGFAACVAVRLMVAERNTESISFATTPRYASSYSIDEPDNIVARMPSFNADLAAMASQRRYEQKSWLQRIFYRHGKFCAEHPLIVLCATVLIIVAASCGIIFVQWNNDPVTLWSSPQSRSAQELDYFNSNFGPFYRIEQMIITSQYPDTDMLSNDILNRVLMRQDQVSNITATFYVDGVGYATNFQDLCFRPTPGAACLIESPLEWWQSSGERLNNTNDPAAYIERVC
jgi:Niemann-Pick C1 protein